MTSGSGRWMYPWRLTAPCLLRTGTTLAWAAAQQQNPKRDGSSESRQTLANTTLRKRKSRLHKRPSSFLRTQTRRLATWHGTIFMNLGQKRKMSFWICIMMASLSPKPGHSGCSPRFPEKKVITYKRRYAMGIQTYGSSVYGSQGNRALDLSKW